MPQINYILYQTFQEYFRLSKNIIIIYKKNTAYLLDLLNMWVFEIINFIYKEHVHLIY